MNGNERIRSAFKNAHKAALMPYFTLGYPDLPTSIDIIEACCKAGADLMELGVPFSDPLADGPTIQYSTQVSLQQGTTVAGCLEAVRELRSRGVQIPFMLMGYANPMMRYGTARYAADAAAAGAEGFIIPDLPPDEAGDFRVQCDANGLALIHLLSPNSTESRVRLVTERSSAFIYLVSVTGITGERSELPPELAGFIERVRRAAPEIPLAVGFGIGSPSQVGAVADIADGVIVGSALISAVRNAIEAGSDPVKAAAGFVRSLAGATY